MHPVAESRALTPTGVPGLDAVLRGGLPAGGIYVVQGGPGTGKTTLALQFLRRGVEDGRRCLFLTLSESVEGIKAASASFGWSLDGIALHQLSRHRERAHLASRQVVFDRSEVETDELMEELLGAVDRHDPGLVVFDAMSHLRLLTEDELTYRRQLLVLRDYFQQSRATVLINNNGEVARSHGELTDIASGVIALDRFNTALGVERRKVQVIKVRGHRYYSGRHDLDITPDGLVVAPRLSTGVDGDGGEPLPISSGDANLDQLMGGGLPTGTSTLLVGPSGTGKSTVSSLYAMEAASKHGGALVYLFDETERTFRQRSAALGLPAEPLLRRGALRVRHIPNATMSAGFFARTLHQDLTASGARVVVLDSLTGYLNAVGSARELETQMHDLLMALNNRNVLSLLIVAQHGLFGSSVHDPLDVSYLADAVVMLRHYEHRGRLKRCISVFKKRYGPHENSIRELLLGNGVTAGEPLVGLENVLSGAPRLLEEQGVRDRDVG